MGNSTTVLKVEMDANVDLLRRYHLERKKWQEENGGDANEVWLWHATSSNGAEQSIVENAGLILSTMARAFTWPRTAS
jgi:hypothetical protein